MIPEAWYVRAVIPIVGDGRKTQKFMNKLNKMLEHGGSDDYTLIVGISKPDADRVFITLKTEEERLLAEEALRNKETQ